MPGLSRRGRLRCPLSGLVHLCGCHWSLADDQKRHVFILGAIPMHTVAEMGDKCALLHRDREARRIILVTGADPPGAGEHHGEESARMNMWAGEISAFVQGEHLHEETRLVWIAGEVCDLKAPVVLPRNLVREHDGGGGRVSARPRTFALG